MRRRAGGPTATEHGQETPRAREAFAPRRGAEGKARGACGRQGLEQAPEHSAARQRRAAAPRNASSGQGEGQIWKEQRVGFSFT